MKNQVIGLRVAAALFAIFGLLQLTRLFVRPEIVVSGHLLPLWPSVVAIIVLAALAVWLWNMTMAKRA